MLPWKDHLSGELEATGVVTTCLSVRRRDPLWPWRLRALLGQVDVVHAHAPTTAAAARLVARTLPRRKRPAVVVTEHNTQDSYRRPTRWINRLTSGGDAATWTVTEEARDSLRGSAAQRAEVLVHGVDVAGIRGARRAVTPDDPPGPRHRRRRRRHRHRGQLPRPEGLPQPARRGPGARRSGRRVPGGRRRPGPVGARHHRTARRAGPDRPRRPGRVPTGRHRRAAGLRRVRAGLGMGGAAGGSDGGDGARSAHRGDSRWGCRRAPRRCGRHPRAAARPERPGRRTGDGRRRCRPAGRAGRRIACCGRAVRHPTRRGGADRSLSLAGAARRGTVDRPTDPTRCGGRHDRAPRSGRSTMPTATR